LSKEKNIAGRLSDFGFAARCAELRGFAAKISQTVEATVKMREALEYFAIQVK
jgi:hypothetical protein